MRELPSPNNVYGFLFSRTSLEKVAEVLRSRLGLTKTEVYVYRSGFDGSETLKVRTEAYEFETQKAKENNTWLFSGSVAGNLDEILTVLKLLSSHLRWAGYDTKFEIYDQEFDCIAEYP